MHVKQTAVGLIIDLGDSRDPEFPLRWEIAQRLLAAYRTALT